MTGCPVCATRQPSMNTGEQCLQCSYTFTQDQVGHNTEALELHGDTSPLDDIHDISPADEPHYHSQALTEEEEHDLMMRQLMEDMYAYEDEEEPF